MPPRKRPIDDDEFARHERNQEEILWLQDFVFNIKDVPFPTILLVGKRFSGKSYTSVSIAAKFDVPRWAAWCGTKDTEDFWAERFESSATVKGPDEKGKAYLINVIRYQQRKGRLYKKILKQPFPRKFRVGLIFDDVTAKRQFRKGEILEDLFSNGRHYHSVIIISAQYLKQLPPAVRLNTDYMFMMHNTKRTIKVLYEDYVEEPDEFGMFLDLVRSVTGQKNAQGEDIYNALVYDNVTKTQKLEEIFKIYRNEGEKYIDAVKLGDQSWREYNKAHYKDEDFENELREHRKQERMARLRQYREQQILRRSTMGGPGGPGLMKADLDFYDDTDSEDEDESTRQDSVTLQHRGGPTTRVNFMKYPTSANPLSTAPSTTSAMSTKWTMPQTSGYGSSSTVAQQQQQYPAFYQPPQPHQTVQSNPWSSQPQTTYPQQPVQSNPWLPQQSQQTPQSVPSYNPWLPQQSQQMPQPSSMWQQQPTVYRPATTTAYQFQQQPSAVWQPQYTPATSYQYQQPQQQQYRPPMTTTYQYQQQQFQQPQQQSMWQQKPSLPSWSSQQEFLRANSTYVPSPSYTTNQRFLL